MIEISRAALVAAFLAAFLAGPLATAGPSAPPSSLRPPADRVVLVDPEGILRFADDRSEVALFGVNYYAPFWHERTNLKALGLDPKDVIPIDIGHLARLGLDALRLHVFDREISDESGNLVEGEPLDLLDLLVAEAKGRGIHTVLTPIAWWPTVAGTRGFSDVHAMAEMIVKPEALEAQERYLGQFLRRRNPRTGLRYADDPAVPVLEIMNEPIPAPGTPDDAVVAYIDRMVAAIRETGCRKPIFYNGWGGRLGAVARSRADGATFGWYPTGLVAGRRLRADFLGRVDEHPEMASQDLGRKARIVYEFDAADVGGSFMYPAMARAFRTGGAQIATQFQYDPMPIAASNADWQTHYLNLIHTPGKAISMAIAAEAFRRLPRGKAWGRHPEADRFGEFRVSFDEDLSEMASRTALLHSSSTATAPPAPADLERIAGCGSSPVVAYEGTGAYFIDRIAPGAWRLEVEPDAVWTADPFGPTRLDREVSRVFWRRRGMTIRLPDLGGTFEAARIAGGAAATTIAAAGRFEVEPGVWILEREGVRVDPGSISREFAAPPGRDLPPAVLHEPPPAILAGDDFRIRATVASVDPRAVILHIGRPGSEVRAIPMREVRPYIFEAAVPGDLAGPGEIASCIAVDQGGTVLVFPDPAAGPAHSRFGRCEEIEILRFEPGGPAPAVAFNGAPGQRAEARIVAGSRPGAGALRLGATGFGPPPSAAGVRLLVAAPAARPFRQLILRARRTEAASRAVEIGLVESGGKARGCEVALGDGFVDVPIDLERLRPLWGTPGGSLRPERLTEVSIVLGSWLFPEAAGEPQGIEIERVALAERPPAWRVPVVPREGPVNLLDAGSRMVQVQGPPGWTVGTAAGSVPGAAAARIAAPSFAAPPTCASVRVDLEDLAAVVRPILGEMAALRIRARAGRPATRAIEVVLSEGDGTPWGTAPEIGPEWRDIRIPVGELRHFAHWAAGPRDRGGPGDRIRLERLASLQLTFGAWMDPARSGEPGAVEIESIGMER